MTMQTYHWVPEMITFIWLVICTVSGYNSTIDALITVNSSKDDMSQSMGATNAFGGSMELEKENSMLSTS